MSRGVSRLTAIGPQPNRSAKNCPTHHRRAAQVLAANPQTCSKWLVNRSNSS
jgi:hypothetical protein